ncbi:MAG TPA: sugar ABC transporter permease [Gemmatimonadales bacterium]|nr:sugar ABC transporter permease [Gemmatimonadales bacterium]
MSAGPGVARWRLAALVAVGVTALLAVAQTPLARAHYERALAERSAVSTAAYLALVTPPGRSGSGYDLPQLFIRSRALEALPGFRARVEVYHGTAPLVHATGDLLASETLDGLRRQPAVRWTGNGALAPLFDRDGWHVVGAVAAQADLPEGPRAAWVAGVLVFALVAGGLAAQAVGASPDATRAAIRRYAAAAALLGLVAAADVWAAARDSSDQWLGDTRLLLQEAARLLPAARSAPSLAVIAPDAEVVAGDSGGPAPERREVAGLPRASVAVRLAPGHWAELRTAPAEVGALGRLALAAALALLGPLGVTGAAWGARASAAPRHLRETLAGWGFLLPSALPLAVFTGAPLVFALYLSLHRWSVTEPVHPFVGLANYARLVRDPLVGRSLANAALYVLYVPVSLVLALAVALRLNRQAWGARALRTAFVLPYMASGVAIALVWQALYRPDGGLINTAVAAAHLSPLDWLGDPRTALGALMIVGAWVHLGYQMLVYLVGLQGIPRAYLDAARVDGANAWQRFRRITLPLLRPVTRFLLVTGIVGAFQVFTAIFVLTGGGPSHTTDVVTYRIYQTAWEYGQFGVTSALALVVCLVLGAAAWAEFRLLGRRGADA